MEKPAPAVAATDPLCIIATSLGTVETKELMAFLKKYFSEESVRLVLIGYPLNTDGSAHARNAAGKWLYAGIQKCVSGNAYGTGR